MVVWVWQVALGCAGCSGPPRRTHGGALYATYALGYLGYWSGDADSAVRDLRAAARPFGTDLQVAVAMGMGSLLSERGDGVLAGGANQQARAFADEAGPMHGGGAKRIARVVLLSVAAGPALDDGDLEGATGRAAACVSAALAMTFAYPLAIGLETAGIVLHAAGLAAAAQLGRLLDPAAAIRAAGDRPAPSGLGRQVRLLRAAVPPQAGETIADLPDGATAEQFALDLLRIRPRGSPHTATAVV